MSITLVNLRARVRRYVNEVSPSTGIGSDSDLNVTINDAYEEIRNKIAAFDPWYIETDTTMTYTANAQSVALPAAAYRERILMVEDETDGTARPKVLSPIDQSDRRMYDAWPVEWSGAGSLTTMSPDYYTFQGVNIRLVPPPSGNRTLRISYVPAVTALSSDGDLPSDIPSSHHQLIALIAAQTILGYDRRESKWIDAKIEALMETLEDATSPRQTQEPGYVRYGGD